MVEDYLEVLNEEAISIISEERQQDMANMYILLRSVPKNLTKYMNGFKDHISSDGSLRLNEIKGDNVSWVESVEFSIVDILNRIMCCVTDVYVICGNRHIYLS